MTPDRYSGDPRIIISPAGWTLDYEGGQPVMDTGLENQVIISLFTRRGWCGNSYLPAAEQIGSSFLDACSQALSVQALANIVNAAQLAIASPLFPQVKITVTNPNSWDLQIRIDLGPGSALTLNRRGLLWSSQSTNPASARLVKTS